MSELEGTIQFAYELTPSQHPALDAHSFAELAAWRSILSELQLLGQSPNLYQGFAYGNLSVRADLPSTAEQDRQTSQEQEFVITASQTSGEQTLQADHLVRITHCNLERFWVDAQGAEPPSSESLTHAMVYAADPIMRFVFHVHSPELWQHRNALGLPETPAEVSYGSLEMISAVRYLMATHQSRPLVFATAGHEDGIFACGHTARDCGGLLVTYLAKARALHLDQATEEH